MQIVPKCPRCGHAIPSDERPGQYPGALSRYDNATEVCSACGVKEAMWQFSQNEPLPPTNVELVV